MREVLVLNGYHVQDFATCEEFLEVYSPNVASCLLVDAYLPGMRGMALLQQLKDVHADIGAVMITAYGDVATAVMAMKAGALDFVAKPIGAAQLIHTVRRAFAEAGLLHSGDAAQSAAAALVSTLTPRQNEIMKLVLAGHPNKMIAAELLISQRTVEHYCATVMAKMGADSIPALARTAVLAHSPLQSKAT